MTQGKDPEPWNEVYLEKIKKQAVSFLIISRRNQLCRYLDQNPVKLTWDFLRPELRENKCIVFKQLNLWQIVTEAIGNIL